MRSRRSENDLYGCSRSETRCLGAGVIPRSLGEGLKASGYDENAREFLMGVAGDFSEFKFVTGRKFAFRPPKTVVIGPYEPDFRLLILHEVGHAVLKHKDFRTDVERLKMEVMAWEEAKKLAIKYCVQYNDELVQGELDSYRDWLHQRSRCPKCRLTRAQTPDGVYHCPRCESFGFGHGGR